jgi:hypothetical protein
MSHTIYAANEKVTFTGACANEIIPSINRSFVYKTKEGGHVRIVVNILNSARLKTYIKKTLNIQSWVAQKKSNPLPQLNYNCIRVR